VLDDEPARGLRQGADAADHRELIPAEPSQRLPASAKSYWRVSTGGWALGAVIAAMAVAGPLGGIAWVPVAAVAVLGVAAVVALPELRWRRWRYEIRDDEIDLQRGAFTIRRTLIPIRRVQHVDSAESWLQKEFGVATVTFHTAAGGTVIPAIERSAAEDVRRRVADRAKALDDV
jgi:membrane protein YdbS with pleckstrin-like domain